MPGLNQTGPEGQGSMTGRKMGRCTNYDRNFKKTENTSPEKQNDNSPDSLPERGFCFGLRRVGSGRGRGRGMGLQNRLRGGI